ncbi:hypothetical protein D3C75_1066420 [compost metagenome]
MAALWTLAAIRNGALTRQTAAPTFRLPPRRPHLRLKNCNKLLLLVPTRPPNWKPLRPALRLQALVVLPVVATASSCWMPRQARLIRPLASRLPLSVLPQMTTAWIWAAWTMPITRTPPRLRANPA